MNKEKSSNKKILQRKEALVAEISNGKRAQDITNNFTDIKIGSKVDRINRRR